MPVHSSATIEIDKKYLKFSAAHFTIFSATERERLHGHNFSVGVSVTAAVDENGMCFDYRELKSRVQSLCEELDEYTLLPAQSPFLRITEHEEHYLAEFNGETLRFAKPDTKLLPVRNTTVEEYSRYLLSRLLEDRAFFGPDRVESVVLKVSSAPGQYGVACWSADAR
ncbi:MAG: 6-carboxytetrahydropterin synthase [Gammaproteobacteria bacterium]|nr:6-carboxytetrahydropterin synthase [Gammaproteobacteria bacterium]